METSPLRAYLVDDEPLAIERLQRMLAKYQSIHIIGSATDPASAIDFLANESKQSDRSVDVLFLDIQMPGMSGFELLARLPVQPLVIFTTAYNEYALKAFEVNSIDYLLKPIEREQLDRALSKLGRIRPVIQPDWQRSPDLPVLLKELAQTLRGQSTTYPRRIASRVGERISFLDLDAVTHFVTQDKLTYAIVNGSKHSVDQTVANLESRLDPAKFIRIHRSALVNIHWIQEVNRGFAGKVILSLRDARHTQLTVARDRVAILKSCQGIL